MSESQNLARRSFVKTAGIGVLGATGLAVGLGAGSPAAANNVQAGGLELVDAGVGMHGSMTTASMLSTATISKHSVSCGVGSAALDTAVLAGIPVIGGMVPSLPVIGDGWTGPMAMLMLSYSITSFKIDRAHGMLRAEGQMRSITKIAGVMIEDIVHPFVSVAKDGRGMGRDTFAVSFKTPFWAVGGNPLATKSDVVDGWSMFGGPFLIGEVNVKK